MFNKIFNMCIQILQCDYSISLELANEAEFVGQGGLFSGD